MSEVLTAGAIFIDVCTISASKAERSEYKLVRDLFSSDKCLRESMYSSFRIDNTSGELQLNLSSLVKLGPISFSHLRRPGRGGGLW